MEDKKQLREQKKEEKRKLKEQKKIDKGNIKKAKPKMNAEQKIKRLATILIATILLLAMLIPSIIGIFELVKGE